MVISSGGTTVPGSPAHPKYLKASIYIPPAFISHHSDLHCSIINIIQHYIETVGVRTVTMWSQWVWQDLHYSLTQVGNPQKNTLVNAIPSPEYNSAHYTFLGQPYRITTHLSAAPVQAPSPVSSTASFEFSKDPDMSMLIILDLNQCISELQDQIHVLQQHISDLEEQVNVANLHSALLTTLHQWVHDRIVYLEGQVQRFAADRSTSTSTPAWNKATPSHPVPIQTQTPSGYGNHTSPQTPSQCHFYSPSGTPTVMYTLHLGTPPASCPAQTSSSALPSASWTTHTSASLNGSNGDGLSPPCITLLPY